MRSVLSASGFPAGLTSTCLLVLMLGACGATAQQIGSLTSVEEETETDTGRTRHPYVLAVSGSYVNLMPINILKEEIYDINDLTRGGRGVSADLRLYILDGLAISVGGMRSGFQLVDDKPDEMATINSRFEGDSITPDNFLRLDGLFFNLTAYVGNRLMPDSRFNPYLRGGVLYFDWALEEDGRGSDPIMYQDEVIEGKDFGGGLGIGTEYRLARKANLDFQVFWGYVMTSDEIKFEGLQSPVNGSYYWTNTHFWNMSLGLVIGL
ncbi:hypothetical protein KKG45_00290 [bacterium]|nr:hypothetical protein [bacterium]MBU1071662.1 hypothetical protein [bacterium]MBU1676402.1 hypothetical protein [bacterium]